MAIFNSKLLVHQRVYNSNDSNVPFFSEGISISMGSHGCVVLVVSCRCKGRRKMRVRGDVGGLFLTKVDQFLGVLHMVNFVGGFLFFYIFLVSSCSLHFIICGITS